MAKKKTDGAEPPSALPQEATVPTPQDALPPEQATATPPAQNGKARQIKINSRLSVHP